MDGFENRDFLFDENGLQNVCLVTSRKEIVSSDCVGEKERENSQLSYCDIIPTENITQG